MKSDLDGALAATDTALAMVDTAVHRAGLRAGDDPDPARTPEGQAVLYDLAHAAAGVGIARSVLGYGAHGDDEAAIACAFVGDAIHDLATRVLGREADCVR